MEKESEQLQKEPLVVYFTGTHSIGKTTLVNKLQHVLHILGIRTYVHGIRIVDDNGLQHEFTSNERLAKYYGFTLNRHTTFRTQEYLLHKNAETEILSRHFAKRDGYRVILMQRGLWDIIPYSRYSSLLDCDQMNYLFNAVSAFMQMHKPGLVFVPEMLDKIDVDGGVRDDDIEYQKNIAEGFEQLFKQLSIKTVDVPKFSSVKEQSISMRVEFCLHHILRALYAEGVTNE